MRATALFMFLFSLSLTACSFGDCDPTLPLAECPGEVVVDDDDSAAGDDDDDTTPGDDDTTEEDPTPDDDDTSGDDDATPQPDDDDTTPPDDDDVTTDDDDSATPPGDDDDSTPDDDDSGDDDTTPPDDDDVTSDDDDSTPADDDDTAGDDDSTPDPDADGDGYTEVGGDCNDSDATIYPGATEIEDDGVDQDCDGSDATTVCDPLTEYDNIPYQDIRGRYIHYDVAEFVFVGFLPQYLDAEPVNEMDCRDSGDCQQVYVYSDGSCGGTLEDANPIWVADPMPDTEDPSYNGLAWSVDENGDIIEFNYLASCGDGSYSANVHPDGGAYLNSCDDALNSPSDTSPTWYGAFGGTHYSLTQVMREEEVTAGMYRPGVIDLPFNRYYYGSDGWTWPGSSEDSYASSLYSGAIECLQAGSVVAFGDWTDLDGDTEVDVGEVTAFDCDTLASDAARAQCIPCSGYGCVASDDSYGTDEVQIPLEADAIDAFNSEYGVDVTNAYLYEGDGSATADYVDEMYDLFENHMFCLNNASVAWTE